MDYEQYWAAFPDTPYETEHTGEEIINLLATLSRELGVTVISATHDHKMLATSDRILWIKDGKKDRLERREDLNIRIGTVR
jgi:putative ABC transport system ATP-binding protein